MIDIAGLFNTITFIAAYISSPNSFPEPLTREEEAKTLAALAEGDEEAREKLIRHNLRLVAHIAKKYNGSGVDFDDLISIGTIGLIKAVSTFDAKKAATLAAYASRCIQNEVLMTIRSNKKRRGEVSLSDPIGVDKEGNEITLADVMGTPADLVIDEVELELKKQRLKQLMTSCLEARERLVVALRFGLYNNVPLPQREVAKRLGISRSYV